MKIPILPEELAQNNGVKIYSTVTVGSKGQIVIPKEVRIALNINFGDNLIVITKHNKAVGMVKIDDINELLDFMKTEIDSYKKLINKK
ncbi:AbrB/MazE/SpoVT family DNA-binding domain-containing protein [Candidatus Gracilibacteria bacterium]|nr:AbrB/MazE/SpoVT family DNA-binding domain-containing protein [Candidatus Gracilibacteria bacterium]